MVKRAAVIIGVDKTGTLPKLRDAASSATRVAAWARAQGIDAVELLTDADGPVEVSQVKKAIRGMVDAGVYHQLLVFFAGHGVNRQRQEYWMLSGAPDDSQEAVNLAGSSALAMTSGIPHVIFISDACRTAAEGIQAQSVTGSEIFPNIEGNTGTVDQFFACELGRPSHELRDPNVTAAEFSALYTNEMLPALSGARSEVVEWDALNAQVGHVHLRPLRDYLSKAVTDRLKGLALQTKVIQVPTAIIASDPPAWIAEVKRPSRGLGFGPLTGMAANRGQPMPPVLTPRPSLDETIAAVQSGASPAAGGGARTVVESAKQLASPFGPTHHETQCGFKIRGALIVEAYSPQVYTQVIAPGDDVRVGAPSWNSVLLLLDTGVGVLLPAIPGFITALTVDEGELVDVTYEPSDNSPRWGDYRARAEELRALRAIASASLTNGAFHLERTDALDVARRMQYAKGIDPSLAVYAAYDYHDLQRQDLLREMASYLTADLGAPLFDVALFARQLDRRSATDWQVISPMPLLSQGWALLNAYRVRLAKELTGLDQHLSPSLWTLLLPHGVQQVRAALASGAIR